MLVQKKTKMRLLYCYSNQFKKFRAYAISFNNSLFHSKNLGCSLDADPEGITTEPSSKKLYSSQNISSIDDSGHLRNNTLAEKRVGKDGLLRSPKYNHQHWCRKEPIVRRKNYTATNLPVFDSRKRQYAY